MHGTPDTPIWVRAGAPSEGTVRIEVHDLAPPIPQEWQRSLFEPLTRGAGAAGQTLHAQQRSVGLGLYIASEIAKAHGGKVNLVSSDQDGTAFAVQLPKQPPHPPRG